MTTSVSMFQVKILSFPLCAASAAWRNIRPTASSCLHGASDFRFMCGGTVRTSVSSVTNNSMLWFLTDLIMSLDRKLKSSVLFSSTRRQFCYCPGTTTEVPKIMLFRLSGRLRSHTRSSQVADIYWEITNGMDTSLAYSPKVLLFQTLAFEQSLFHQVLRT